MFYGWKRNWGPVSVRNVQMGTSLVDSQAHFPSGYWMTRRAPPRAANFSYHVPLKGRRSRFSGCTPSFLPLSIFLHQVAFPHRPVTKSTLNPVLNTQKCLFVARHSLLSLLLSLRGVIRSPSQTTTAPPASRCMAPTSEHQNLPRT
jgi:hypothetical protein